MKRFVSLLVAVWFVALAVPVFGQTIVNPSILEYDPSPDHNASFVDASGATVQAVTNYTWEVFNAAGVLVQSFNLQKPTPNATSGKIVVDIRPQLATLTPNLTYTSKVNTIGPGGSVPSSASNPFVIGGVAPVPRPATNITIKKLT